VMTETGKKLCIAANDGNLAGVKEILAKGGLNSTVVNEAYGEPAVTALDGAIWNRNQEMVHCLLPFGAKSANFIKLPNSDDWMWFAKIEESWIHVKKTWQVKLVPGNIVFDVYEDATVLDFKKLIQTLWGDDPEDFAVFAGTNVVCCNSEQMILYRKYVNFNLQKAGPSGGAYTLKKNRK